MAVDYAKVYANTIVDKTPDQIAKIDIAFKDKYDYVPDTEAVVPEKPIPVEEADAPAQVVPDASTTPSSGDSLDTPESPDPVVPKETTSTEPKDPDQANLYNQIANTRARITDLRNEGRNSEADKFGYDLSKMESRYANTYGEELPEYMTPLNAPAGKEIPVVEEEDKGPDLQTRINTESARLDEKYEGVSKDLINNSKVIQRFKSVFDKQTKPKVQAKAQELMAQYPDWANDPDVKAKIFSAGGMLDVFYNDLYRKAVHASSVIKKEEERIGGLVRSQYTAEYKPFLESLEPEARAKYESKNYFGAAGRVLLPIIGLALDQLSDDNFANTLADTIGQSFNSTTGNIKDASDIAGISYDANRVNKLLSVNQKQFDNGDISEQAYQGNLERYNKRKGILIGERLDEMGEMKDDQLVSQLITNTITDIDDPEFYTLGNAVLLIADQSFNFALGISTSLLKSNPYTIGAGYALQAVSVAAYGLQEYTEYEEKGLRAAYSRINGTAEEEITAEQLAEFALTPEGIDISKDAGIQAAASGALSTAIDAVTFGTGAAIKSSKVAKKIFDQARKFKHLQRLRTTKTFKATTALVNLGLIGTGEGVEEVTQLGIGDYGAQRQREPDSSVVTNLGNVIKNANKKEYKTAAIIGAIAGAGSSSISTALNIGKIAFDPNEPIINLKKIASLSPQDFEDFMEVSKAEYSAIYNNPLRPENVRNAAKIHLTKLNDLELANNELKNYPKIQGKARARTLELLSERARISRAIEGAGGTGLAANTKERLKVIDEKLASVERRAKRGYKSTFLEKIRGVVGPGRSVGAQKAANIPQKIIDNIDAQLQAGLGIPAIIKGSKDFIKGLGFNAQSVEEANQTLNAELSKFDQSQFTRFSAYLSAQEDSSTSYKQGESGVDIKGKAAKSAQGDRPSISLPGVPTEGPINSSDKAKTIKAYHDAGLRVPERIAKRFEDAGYVAPITLRDEGQALPGENIPVLDRISQILAASENKESLGLVAASQKLITSELEKRFPKGKNFTGNQKSLKNEGWLVPRTKSDVSVAESQLNQNTLTSPDPALTGSIIQALTELVDTKYLLDGLVRQHMNEAGNGIWDNMLQRAVEASNKVSAETDKKKKKILDLELGKVLGGLKSLYNTGLKEVENMIAEEASENDNYPAFFKPEKGYFVLEFENKFANTLITDMFPTRGEEIFKMMGIREWSSLMVQFNRWQADPSKANNKAKVEKAVAELYTKYKAKTTPKGIKVDLEAERKSRAGAYGILKKSVKEPKKPEIKTKRVGEIDREREYKIAQIYNEAGFNINDDSEEAKKHGKQTAEEIDKLLEKVEEMTWDEGDAYDNIIEARDRFDSNDEWVKTVRALFQVNSLGFGVERNKAAFNKFMQTHGKDTMFPHEKRLYATIKSLNTGNKILAFRGWGADKSEDGPQADIFKEGFPVSWTVDGGNAEQFATYLGDGTFQSAELPENRILAFWSTAPSSIDGDNELILDTETKTTELGEGIVSEVEDKGLRHITLAVTEESKDKVHTEEELNTAQVRWDTLAKDDKTLYEGNLLYMGTVGKLRRGDKDFDTMFGRYANIVGRSQAKAFINNLKRVPFETPNVDVSTRGGEAYSKVALLRQLWQDQVFGSDFANETNVSFINDLPGSPANMEIASVRQRAADLKNEINTLPDGTYKSERRVQLYDLTNRLADLEAAREVSKSLPTVDAVLAPTGEIKFHDQNIITYASVILDGQQLGVSAEARKKFRIPPEMRRNISIEELQAHAQVVQEAAREINQLIEKQALLSAEARTVGIVQDLDVTLSQGDTTRIDNALTKAKQLEDKKQAARELQLESATYIVAAEIGYVKVEGLKGPMQDLKVTNNKIGEGLPDVTNKAVDSEIAELDARKEAAQKKLIHLEALAEREGTSENATKASEGLESLRQEGILVKREDGNLGKVHDVVLEETNLAETISKTTKSDLFDEFHQPGGQEEFIYALVNDEEFVKDIISEGVETINDAIIMTRFSAQGYHQGFDDRKGIAAAMKKLVAAGGDESLFFTKSDDAILESKYNLVKEDNKGKYVIVYRGVNLDKSEIRTELAEGESLTLDRKHAEFFAGYESKGKGSLISAKVYLEDILLNRPLAEELEVILTKPVDVLDIVDPKEEAAQKKLDALEDNSDNTLPRLALMNEISMINFHTNSRKSLKKLKGLKVDVKKKLADARFNETEGTKARTKKAKQSAEAAITRLEKALNEVKDTMTSHKGKVLIGVSLGDIMDAISYGLHSVDVDGYPTTASIISNIAEVLPFKFEATTDAAQIRENRVASQYAASRLVTMLETEGIITETPPEYMMDSYKTEIIDQDFVTAFQEGINLANVDPNSSLSRRLKRDKKGWNQLQFNGIQNWTSNQHPSGAKASKKMAKEEIEIFNKEPRVFKILNKAKDTKMNTNDELANIVEHMVEIEHPALIFTNKNYSEKQRRAKIRERDAIRSKSREAKGKPFQYNYIFGSRGRLYAAASFLNQQASKHAKATIKFAKKKPMGSDGWGWLLADVGEAFGAKVNSLDDLQAFGFAHIEEGMKWLNEPVKYADKIFGDSEGKGGVDEPMLYLAAMIEVKNALAHGDPTTYPSNYVSYIDASVSGVQVLGGLMAAMNELQYVNMLPGHVKSDLYAKVFEGIADKRLILNPDEEQLRIYTEIQQTLDDFKAEAAEARGTGEAVFIQKPRSVKKMSATQYVNHKKGLFRDKMKDEGLWDIYNGVYWGQKRLVDAGRKASKGPVMTKNYNSVVSGMSDALYDLFSIEKDIDITKDNTRWLAEELDAGADLLLPNIKDLRARLAVVAEDLYDDGKDFGIIGDTSGFPYKLPYREADILKLKHEFGGVIEGAVQQDLMDNKILQLDIAVGNTEELDRRRILNGIVANFTHAFDKEIIAWMYLNTNYDLLTVHDSVGTHLADMTSAFDDNRKAYNATINPDTFEKAMAQNVGAEQAKIDRDELADGDWKQEYAFQNQHNFGKSGKFDADKALAHLWDRVGGVPDKTLAEASDGVTVAEAKEDRLVFKQNAPVTIEGKGGTQEVVLPDSLQEQFDELESRSTSVSRRANEWHKESARKVNWTQNIINYLRGQEDFKGDPAGLQALDTSISVYQNELLKAESATGDLDALAAAYEAFEDQVQVFSEFNSPKLLEAGGQLQNALNGWYLDTLSNAVEQDVGYESNIDKFFASVLNREKADTKQEEQEESTTFIDENESTEPSLAIDSFLDLDEDIENEEDKDETCPTNL